MKIILRGSLLLLLSLSASFAQKPNVILIMADDLGFSDIGCYGSEILTPNLDKLAAGGIRFTQFYNAARCCPTRASLLTGLYPHQAGMGEMVRTGGDRSRETPYQGRLGRETVTIAEALKNAGYKTYMSGKWHVGEDRPEWPLQRGFDQYFGLISGANSYFELLPNRLFLNNNEPYTIPENFYMTDAITDKALDYIGQNPKTGSPFFLYVAYTAPHWPLHAPDEEIQRYREAYRKGWDKLRSERYEKQRKIGLFTQDVGLSKRDSTVGDWENTPNKEEWCLKMATYAAMVTRMDAGIGKIVEALKTSGQLDNTMILFLSDNGACAEIIDNRAKRDLGDEGYAVSLTTPIGRKGSYKAYGKEWATLGNTPFRLYKQYTHEGGISTPLIVHYPKLIKKAGQTDQVGHVMDILPTCLDVAGAAYPPTRSGQPIKPLEGKSLLPVLEGKVRQPHPFLAWEHIGCRALRKENWKLVWSKIDKEWELYDLANDRSETQNLIHSKPQKFRELLHLYNTWASKIGVNER